MVHPDPPEHASERIELVEIEGDASSDEVRSAIEAEATSSGKQALIGLLIFLMGLAVSVLGVGNEIGVHNLQLSAVGKVTTTSAGVIAMVIGGAIILKSRPRYKFRSRETKSR